MSANGAELMKEDSLENMKHPMQPIGWDGADDRTEVIRFKENKRVSLLLETSSLTLNEIAYMLKKGMADRDDWLQLMQLIGYSVSGIGDLSEIPEEFVKEADAIAEQVYKRRYPNGEPGDHVQEEDPALLR
jgi:hypothetical protein